MSSSHPPSTPLPDLPSDGEALDAYSRIVTSVAERLAPSVANLRVRRRGRRREAVGGGSAVVLSARRLHAHLRPRRRRR